MANTDNQKAAAKSCTATCRSIRTSPRKLNLVAQTIRGLNAEKAVAELTFSKRRVAKVALQLLKSAIANAENNHGLAHQKLYISEIYANQGPTLKRIRPAAKGSAVRIRKRTSHITIVLKERD